MNTANITAHHTTDPFYPLGFDRLVSLIVDRIRKHWQPAHPANLIRLPPNETLKGRKHARFGIRGSREEPIISCHLIELLIDNGAGCGKPLVWRMEPIPPLAFKSPGESESISHALIVEEGAIGDFQVVMLQFEAICWEFGLIENLANA